MTTCPSAPRQARGLRGAALRRLAGNKCARIYQTHDMQPNRCDARPLDARWHGEAMTKIEVKATPEWLAQRVVELDNDGNVMLLEPSGDLLARIAPGNVFMSDVLGAVRGWLVQQIEAGYKAGVEAGRAAHRGEMEEGLRNAVPPAEKCLAAAKGDGLIADWQKSGEMSFLVSLGYGPDLDVLAREVSVVLKAIGKARRYEVRARQEVVEQARAEAANIAATVCHNELRGVLGLAHGWEECLATVRDLVAKDKAADGRTAKAHSDAVTMCADQLREALGTTLGWRGCVDAVRDLVAKDKAKSAPTDAAAEDAAIDGLIGDAFRADNASCRALDRDGAGAFLVPGVSTGRARGWLRPWLLAAWARGVAYGQGDISSGESRCAAQLANALGHTSETLPTWEEALALVTRNGPPTLGDFFGMAAREQVAAERTVDAAAMAPSEEAITAAREEGRRAGWSEAMESMRAVFDEKIGEAKKFEREADRLNGLLSHAVADRREALTHADALHRAMIRVEEAAPKEAP